MLSEGTSGLAAEVTTDGPNVFAFNLTTLSDLWHSPSRQERP